MSGASGPYCQGRSRREGQDAFGEGEEVISPFFLLGFYFVCLSVTLCNFFVLYAAVPDPLLLLISFSCWIPLCTVSDEGLPMA